MLKDKKVRDRLNDTKFAEEVAVLNRFTEMFRTAPSRVAYGEKSINYCLEQGAIDVLLVSDKLLRGKTAAMRKRIIQLMDAVKESGGKSFLFSSLHPSGQQLNNVGLDGSVDNSLPASLRSCGSLWRSSSTQKAAVRGVVMKNSYVCSVITIAYICPW